MNGCRRHGVTQTGTELGLRLSLAEGTLGVAYYPRNLNVADYGKDGYCADPQFE